MDTLNFIIKKYKVDTNKPSPINLSISRKDLANLFSELKFKKGVEIGVGDGAYSETLCLSNPKLTLYSVDPWKVYPGYKERITQKSMDQVYKVAKARLKDLNCKVLRDFSERSYKNFFNRSLDFVYIDGNHDEAHVRADIENWSPKVKSGGIIAGGRFAWYKGEYGAYNKVRRTVKDYAATANINPWFALRAPNEHASWMWVKA